MSRTLDARHDHFELNSPFRISRGTKTAIDTVTVTITDGDYSGRGEGVPYARYGETVESALAEITGARSFIERDGTRSGLLTDMQAGAARNAIDCALWDLESHQSHRNVAAIIGAPSPLTMASALTIVLDTPAAMARSAATQAQAPVLKVKVDSMHSADRLRAVREAAPHSILIVDPNESWNEAIVRDLQPLLVQLKVALLEQPVPAEKDDWLEYYSPLVPICADEAVHVSSDLPRLARRYQAVNVKLDKTGGLTAALELADNVLALGLVLMTGCMVCSSLSIAPAMHIARRSTFVDLDGPIWLKHDLPGGVTYDGGMLTPPSHGFWG